MSKYDKDKKEFLMELYKSKINLKKLSLKL